MSEPGPLTVFAPTDAAFAKLPEGTIDNLLQNNAQLTSILAYHVVSGKYKASDVKKHDTLPTLQGQSLKIEVHRLYHCGIQINDVEVLHSDIESTNGVIHVIDSVLMPK
ncbi:MAG: fasciclin domain-containing protein [Halobacteriota archaeon]